MNRKCLSKGLMMLSGLALALAGLACSGGASPQACPHGQVTGTCLCGGEKVSDGFCCFGAPSQTACLAVCPQGQVTGTCWCGGQEISSGHCCFGAPSASACPSGALIADHTAAASFSAVPTSAITQAGAQFRIWYGHTSHGSQIVTGMDMLAQELGAPYLYNQGGGTLQLTEESGDLGHEGDLAWEQTTRQYLAQHAAEVNMVVWSWCGGASDNTEQGIQTYLQAMDRLEQDFPQIKFVYMTGHTDADAVENLRARNAQIRSWCGNHAKVLFDFEDIESWDPAGNFYHDTGDDCGWCSNWCSNHSCPSCGECAHSHCFNCYLKGKAFWWLLARLSGWQG